MLFIIVKFVERTVAWHHIAVFIYNVDGKTMCVDCYNEKHGDRCRQWSIIFQW